MRKPMVTRTFKVTKVTALIANIKDGKTSVVETTVSGQFKDAKKLEKKLHELYDNDEQRFVFVKSTAESEVMYGMSEDKFIQYADELDAVTRKAIASNEQTTEDSAENESEVEADVK